MHIYPRPVAKGGGCSKQKHLKFAGNNAHLMVVLSTDPSMFCHQP